MDINKFIIGKTCSNIKCRKLHPFDETRCSACGSTDLRPVYDYYSLFEISESFSLDELKKAYKKKSLKYHPDINPQGKEIFPIVSEAFQELSESTRKNQYHLIYKNLKNHNYTSPMGEKPFYSQSSTQGPFGQTHFTEEDFENIFRQFHGFSSKEGAHRYRMSQISGSLGAILGALIFSVLLGWVSFVPGIFIGFLIGRFNSRLAGFFLPLANILVILTVFLKAPFILSGGIMTMLFTGFLLYFYFSKSVKWARELKS